MEWRQSDLKPFADGGPGGTSWGFPPMWVPSHSAPQPPHALPELLVADVRVDDRRQRARVLREPLGKEEVPRRPVDVGDRRVPQRVDGVEPVEPGDDLPSAEEDLDAALG